MSLILHAKIRADGAERMCKAMCKGIEKETLESYPQILAEIEELRENLQITLHGALTADTVTGSMREFPYLKHAISISGVCAGLESDDKIKDMRRRLALLIAAQKKIEGFVNSLSNFRTRRIVRLKALQGLSWSEVARLTGGDTSPEAARSIYRRALAG